MLFPVILAGGNGTRLWPLSRSAYPKQFLGLIDEDVTMLQATINRLRGLDIQSPLLVCNEEHRFIVAEQLRGLALDNFRIMLEPERKDTAPAIALAALELLDQHDDPLMLVLAADHYISDVSEFQSKVEASIEVAAKGSLVTFGVQPRLPETGYGYIHVGQEISSIANRIESFIEKPSFQDAEKFCSSSGYLWNSGIFLFKASVLIEELDKYCPEVLDVCRRAYLSKTSDSDFIRVNKEAFSACRSISIDYAVMEKTSTSAVVALDTQWSDVGSWAALWDLTHKDNKGNSFKGDVVGYNTTNTFVRSDNRLVVTVGLNNVLVVETKDVVLIANKDHSQSVKKVVEELSAQGRSECSNHPHVFRPWGIYDLIGEGDRYQVKKITVHPGAKLSLQMHHHRAEHWVVVKGTAKVTNGEETYLVTENQSTYIPVGQIHSLENPGVVDLELIEVQSGSYLGEDDIVRIQDRYGRA